MSVLTRCGYEYKELEALGELLISLPGICRMDGAEDVSSSEIIHELTRIACDFEEEWAKLSLDEHEELGEDWLSEIDKLADWVKEHLYDVLHNRLEYGMYRARKRTWGYSKCKMDCPTEETWVSTDKAAALKSMLDDAAKEVTAGHGSVSTHLEYWDKGWHSDTLPEIKARMGEEFFDYRLISKWEEK